jgi:hypothetical protein
MALIVLMLEGNFFFWFIFMFPLLLFSLYFYVRNLRFLLNKSEHMFFPPSTKFFVLSGWLIFLIFFAFSGFSLLDDLFLFCQWLFF